MTGWSSPPSDQLVPELVPLGHRRQEVVGDLGVVTKHDFGNVVPSLVTSLVTCRSGPLRPDGMVLDGSISVGYLLASISRSGPDRDLESQQEY